ncbi:MAG: septal ring lytic transglycosylase RlpA family protein [Spirochaetes bacterium]|nr:septal ring lytic transglycosylase RlpA family protein [Spirochaetota bacterium]
MSKTLKSMSISFTFMVIIMLFLGCTPGKAQTKGNDYKGSFQNEEFDAFDDDEIPAMNKNNKNVKSDFDAYNDDNEYENKEKYYQKGLASWYGREFHGKTTASGEKFNMNELTAAHKTLPFGTIVEVKNFENGKTVRLKINDRGPYRGSRIIDLSLAGAKEIDMVKSGEANVGIKVLKLGNNSAGSTNNSDKQYVEPVSDAYIYKNTRNEYQSDYSDGLKLQAGAFVSRKNAENLKSTIETMTDRPVKIVQDGNYYKVRIEGLQDAKEMKKLKNMLSEENIPSFSVE